MLNITLITLFSRWNFYLIVVNISVCKVNVLACVLCVAV